MSEKILFKVENALDAIYRGGRCDVVRDEGDALIFMRSESNFCLRNPQTGKAVRERNLVILPLFLVLMMDISAIGQ